jgi:transposase
MAKELVTDELWEIVEPLLPEEPTKPKGGRPCRGSGSPHWHPLLLKSDIPWEMLPKDIGCGYSMTGSGDAARNRRRQACGGDCTESP